jgi:hypothetical protein
MEKDALNVASFFNERTGYTEAWQVAFRVSNYERLFSIRETLAH